MAWTTSVAMPSLLWMELFSLTVGKVFFFLFVSHALYSRVYEGKVAVI